MSFNWLLKYWLEKKIVDLLALNFFPANAELNSVYCWQMKMQALRCCPTWATQMVSGGTSECRWERESLQHLYLWIAYVRCVSIQLLAGGAGWILSLCALLYIYFSSFILNDYEKGEEKVQGQVKESFLLPWRSNLSSVQVIKGEKTWNASSLNSCSNVMGSFPEQEDAPNLERSQEREVTHIPLKIL